MPDSMTYPPGFNKIILRRTPRRYRLDVLQQAWLGYLMERNPSTVARNYLAKESLHEQRERACSQLSDEQRKKYRRRLGRAQ